MKVLTKERRVWRVLTNERQISRVLTNERGSLNILTNAMRGEYDLLQAGRDLRPRLLQLRDQDGGEAHGEAGAEARQVGDDPRQHLNTHSVKKRK